MLDAEGLGASVKRAVASAAQHLGVSHMQASIDLAEPGACLSSTQSGQRLGSVPAGPWTQSCVADSRQTPTSAGATSTISCLSRFGGRVSLRASTASIAPTTSKGSRCESAVSGGSPSVAGEPILVEARPNAC